MPLLGICWGSYFRNDSYGDFSTVLNLNNQNSTPENISTTPVFKFLLMAHRGACPKCKPEPVSGHRLQRAWRTSSGRTTFTETCEQRMSWSPSHSCARSQILALRESSKTTSTRQGKVGASGPLVTRALSSKYTMYLEQIPPQTRCPLPCTSCSPHRHLGFCTSFTCLVRQPAGGGNLLADHVTDG